MKFSNRANARRHERNIHGKPMNLSAAHLLLEHKNQITISASPRPGSLVRPGMIGSAQHSRAAGRSQIIFDYTKPELYRELLTDSKIFFIRRHLEFLEQYQNMRCICCNRDFATYKFFMAHMRKKYNTLSRNLCFKCLKQFDSKSMFIGHLKKKNCINLYKVFCADQSISKEPLPPNATKSNNKEIIANKVYGCKLCDKTFRLKVDFRGHVFEAHPYEPKKDENNPTAQNIMCPFCKSEIDDASVRRRHYNTMECILYLICGTCESRFDSLAQYIEHVYAEHLQPQESSATAAAAVTIKSEPNDEVSNK